MIDDTNDAVISLLTEIRDLLKSRPSSGGSAPSGKYADEPPAERYQNDKGDWLWKIPEGKKPSTCNKCKQEIFWVKSKKGKNVPCDKSGVCHFDTCPEKNQGFSAAASVGDDVPF